MDVPRDHAGMEVLGFDDALRLAGSRPVGRVAYAQDGDVHVLPVNHCVVGSLIAFRTGDGSKLGAAMDGLVVAFEADEFDETRHEGWSVLVKGRAEIVTDDGLAATLAATGTRPWSERVARPTWVVIRPDSVAGQRI